MGSWLSWQDLKWKVKNKAGETEEKDINTIFQNTILLKVGHHGSHNATLKEKGLEQMRDNDLIAMIPVDRKMAEKKHWHMPFSILFDRLKERTSSRILLADEKPTKRGNKPPNISRNEWDKYISSIPEVPGDLYIDYEIKC